MMRVACSTIADFLENLESEPADRVLNKVVYASKTCRPVDGTRRDAVKFSVVFQVGAVVKLEDGGEYLLDGGEDCGMDYHDASQAYGGSERADELRQMVRDVCNRMGLVVRPGLVGE